MSAFNIGDKIKVVNDHTIWLTSYDLPEDTLLTIIDNADDDTGDWVNHEERTIEIDAVETYPNDFEKVVDSYFAVECKIEGQANTFRFGSPHLGAVMNDPVEVITPIELGVFRPNLEDRKVGKVRVELVDEGFPLALREVAKVMTWAQEAKGYKDHDWQNLPNAEMALAAAASRHRTDHIIQRVVDGLEAVECVDHESEIVHKAHEAFGVLAQLELMLRGKFE